MLNGEQAVVLADITLDQLLATTEQISAEDGTSSFLLAADGSVILHENEEYLPKEEGNTILTDHVKIDLSDGAVSTIYDYDGLPAVSLQCFYGTDCLQKTGIMI